MSLRGIQPAKMGEGNSGGTPVSVAIVCAAINSLPRGALTAKGTGQYNGLDKRKDPSKYQRQPGGPLDRLNYHN